MSTFWSDTHYLCVNRQCSGKNVQMCTSKCESSPELVASAIPISHGGIQNGSISVDIYESPWIPLFSAVFSVTWNALYAFPF